MTRQRTVVQHIGTGQSTPFISFPVRHLDDIDVGKNVSVVGYFESSELFDYKMDEAIGVALLILRPDRNEGADLVAALVDLDAEIEVSEPPLAEG